MFLNKNQERSVERQIKKAFGVLLWHNDCGRWVKGYGDINSIKKSEGKHFNQKNWFIGKCPPEVAEDLF